MGVSNYSNYNNLEKDIFNQYTQMLIISGTLEEEAKEIVGRLIDKAIEESKNEGTYGLFPNLGDYILGDLVSNDKETQVFIDNIRETLQIKKQDDVRTEDIKWWWNLNDIERRMMEKYDEISIMAIFKLELEKNSGFSDQIAASNAANVVKKLFPIYGDNRDPRYTSGEDRLIPYELKDRINKYIEKRYNGDPEEYRKAMDESTSFNALIRKEIKLGKI